MFEYFEGKLAMLEPTQAVIDCGGVGYLLEITLTNNLRNLLGPHHLFHRSGDSRAGCDD